MKTVVSLQLKQGPSEIKSLDMSLSLSGVKSFQLIDNLLFVLDTAVCFRYLFSVFIYYDHFLLSVSLHEGVSSQPH